MINLKPYLNKCKKPQDSLIAGKFTELFSLAYKHNWVINYKLGYNWVINSLGYCKQISLTTVTRHFCLALEAVRLFTQCLLFSYATHLLSKGGMEKIMLVKLFRRQKIYSCPWRANNSNLDLSCINTSQ